MNRLIKGKLETLKEFQENYPKSHVGGSIGLFLRGINLLRDLRNSDLDITIDEIDLNRIDLLGYEHSSSNDFDYSIEKNIYDSYVKIDIRICPEPSFDEITFEGIKYNVSKYRDIIFWKTKYAAKGITKHMIDLKVLKCGVPIVVNTDYSDDLPF